MAFTRSSASLAPECTWRREYNGNQYLTIRDRPSRTERSDNLAIRSGGAGIRKRRRGPLRLLEDHKGSVAFRRGLRASRSVRDHYRPAAHDAAVPGSLDGHDWPRGAPPDGHLDPAAANTKSERGR